MTATLIALYSFFFVTIERFHYTVNNAGNMGDNLFFCFSPGATLGCGLYAGTGYTCENEVFSSEDFVNASAHLDALTALHKVGKQSTTQDRE